MRERPVEVCRTSACEHITGFLAAEHPGKARIVSGARNALGRDFTSVQGCWSPALRRPYSQSSRPSEHGRSTKPGSIAVSGAVLAVTCYNYT